MSGGAEAGSRDPTVRVRTLALAAVGQIDARMASIATFALHLWVVREYSLAQIGARGLIDAAFINFLLHGAPIRRTFVSQIFYSIRHFFQEYVQIFYIS